MNAADLGLCWGSLDGVDVLTFLRSAADAGFTGVTLNTALYEDALATGLAPADVRALLDDLGLHVTDIDPHFNWLPGSIALPGDDVIARCTRATERQVFDLAHAVCTDLVNAPPGLAMPEGEQEVVDAFGALCERAAAEGLRVSLEFMPFSRVTDLAFAQRIIAGAGSANGGIMLDCWHHHRGGGSAGDLLAVPGAMLFAVQLDDALPEPMQDMLEETLNYRLLPGEGCIDLPAYVAALRAIGAAPVCDVEVFKDTLRAAAPAERARQLFQACARVL